jgi:hypothetical protein
VKSYGPAWQRYGSLLGDDETGVSVEDNAGVVGAGDLTIHLDDVGVLLGEDETASGSGDLTFLVEDANAVRGGAGDDVTGAGEEVVELLGCESIHAEEFNGAGLREGERLSHDVSFGLYERLFRSHVSSMA